MSSPVLTEPTPERVAALKEEVERSARALRNAINAISHDLREPLRAVRGFSDLILSRYEGELDEQGSHYLSRIHAGAEHLDHLVELLLEYSRVIRHSDRAETVDGAELIRYGLEESSERGSASVRVVGDLPTFEVSPKWFKRGIRHLFDFLRHDPLEERPRGIEVRAYEARTGETAGRGIVLSVEDLHTSPMLLEALERALVSENPLEHLRLPQFGIAVFCEVARKHGVVARLRPRERGASTTELVLYQITDDRPGSGSTVHSEHRHERHRHTPRHSPRR